MYPLMVKKVRKVAEFLADHPDAGLPRNDLARRLSTPTMRITGPGITNMWPFIAREVRAIGVERGQTLWPVRPDHRWGYMCAATTVGLYPAWVHRKRALDVIGRIRRDMEVDGTGADLLMSGVLPRDAERALGRSLDWQEDALASFDRHEADTQAAFDALVTTIRTLPRIT